MGHPPVQEIHLTILQMIKIKERLILMDFDSLFLMKLLNESIIFLIPETNCRYKFNKRALKYIDLHIKKKLADKIVSM